MVALKAHEVARWLSRPDAGKRVVLLYGPDGGLVRERARALLKAAMPADADPMGRIQIDADQLGGAPYRLIEEASTISLFGGRRVLRVMGVSAAVTSGVQTILNDPALDVLVVIEGGDLTPRHPLRVMVERQPDAIALPCYGDDTQSLDQLIDEIVRAQGCTLERDLKADIAARLGSDRAISRREIEKLCLYVGPGGTIDAEAIDAMVGDSAVRSADRVIDAAFGGDLAALDVAFARLRGEQTEAGVLLGSVLRHAAALLEARRQIDQGRAARDVVGQMRGVPFPRRSAIEIALRNWTVEALETLIAGLGRQIAQARLTPALGMELAQRCLWNVVGAAARQQRRR